MDSFETHIIHLLNRGLRDRGMRGEFCIRKFHKEGVFPIQKNMTLVLSYVLPGQSKEVITISKTLSLRKEEIQEGYDALYEELLYTMIHNDVWNLAYGT